MADKPKRPVTPKLIGDWAQLLINGYQTAADDYRRDPSAMNCQVCEACMVMLGNLDAATAVHFPELYASLRLVSPGAIWHASPDFDWDAAECELRQIRSAALSAQVAPRVDQHTVVDADHPLGIHVDVERRTVRRDGYDDAEVDVSGSKVGWHIFRVVYGACPKQADAATMKTGYPGKWDARHAATSSLNKMLEPLGIEVYDRTLRPIK